MDNAFKNYNDFVRHLMEYPEAEETILWEHNIRVREAPLGQDIAGMVYYSRNGYYYIIINWVLEQEERRFVFLHELYHILCETEHSTYLVRLDMTHEELEADMIAEAAASYG